MTTWKLAVLVGAATAATVTGVALALDGNDAGERDRVASAAMVAERGTDEERSAGPRAAMQELMQDPDFREDLWALQDEQKAAMRDWWDTYGDDPTSAEAKDALDELLDQQRTTMTDLMEEYGVDWGDAIGRSGALQELMGDEEFRADLWALQDEAEAAVQSWWDTYGDDPTSDEARKAMKELFDDQRAKIDTLAEKYGVELGDAPMMGRDGGLLGGLLGGVMGDGLFGGGPFGGRGGDMGSSMGGPDGMMAPDGGSTDAGSSAANQTGATL